MVKSTMIETHSAILRSRRNCSSDGAERTDDDGEWTRLVETWSPDPAALAAGQLLCCLVRAIHYGRSPSYLTETVQSVGASRSRTLIFHLVDGLLSTTAVHEVRRVGVLTCGSCHLERSVRPHRHRADPLKFRKLLKSHYFSQAFNICWFLCFSRCFSIWLTFVMHLWSRFWAHYKFLISNMTERNY